MIVYMIEPEPWEHVFWTASVMAGAGLFAGLSVYIIMSHYMRQLARHMDRIYYRLTDLERRLSVMERVNAHPPPPNQPAAPPRDDGIKILR